MTRPANGRTAEEQMSSTWWLKASDAELAKLPEHLRAARAQLMGLQELEEPTSSPEEIAADSLIVKCANRSAHLPDYLVGMLWPSVGFVVQEDRVAIVFLPLPVPGERRPKIVTFTLCPKKLRTWRDARKPAMTPAVIRRRPAVLQRLV